MNGELCALCGDPIRWGFDAVATSWELQMELGAPCHAECVEAAEDDFGEDEVNWS